MKKHLFKIFYAAAILLLLAFVIWIGYHYFEYQKLLENPQLPLIELAPFSKIVKDYYLEFLLPAAICAVIGFILHRISKK